MIVVLIINLYFLFSAHNQPLVHEDQKEKDKQKVCPNIQSRDFYNVDFCNVHNSRDGVYTVMFKTPPQKLHYFKIYVQNIFVFH